MDVEKMVQFNPNDQSQPVTEVMRSAQGGKRQRPSNHTDKRFAGNVDIFVHPSQLKVDPAKPAVAQDKKADDPNQIKPAADPSQINSAANQDDANP